MNTPKLPPLPFAVLDEFGKSCEDRVRDHFAAAIQAQASVVQQEPVMIYHGDCTIDCGEHGHHHVELLKMIPAGSHLYTHPAQQAKPLAWFDNSGKLHGRVSVEQLEQLCREGIVQMQAIHGIKE